MKTIAFFNNKDGVGNTSMVYHLSWMYAEMDRKVIAADLDPQSNLTSMFLDDERLEEIWPETEHTQTILGTVNPIIKGTGDITEPYIESISNNLGLIMGDLGLSTFEDTLSPEWAGCADGKERAFRVTSSFYRTLKQASDTFNAELVLIDIGPNLGAINRAALIAADYIAIPLTPDLYSLQGLRNLGPTLREWRKQWADRRDRYKGTDFPLPAGTMQPLGYILLQHSTRRDWPVRAYEKWMNRIPLEYRKAVLDRLDTTEQSIENDSLCLCLIKPYRSLMPMAMEARKPIFHLTPADGAIGAHANAAKQCAKDFAVLASRIDRVCDALEHTD